MTNAVKVDVFTMEAEPSSHACTIPRGVFHPPFDWPEQRYCIMHTEVYERLMRGVDLVQHTQDVYDANIFGTNFATFNTQEMYADNLMYCLRRMHKRNAYRVAILASWFKADGDHAIAHRVGTYLGKLVDWCFDGRFNSQLWHFP